MKLRIVLPLIAIGGFALTLALALSGSQDAHAITNCDTNTADLDASEQEMLQLLNNARTAAGLAPLKPSPSLNRAAAWMSEDMARRRLLTHTDSLGRQLSRLNDCGYPRAATGENVAATGPSAASTFAAWMASPGHRANMMSENGITASFRVVGIGYSGGYWTMDFGSADDSGSGGTQPPPSTPTPTRTSTTGNTGSATATSTSSSPTPTRTPTPTPTPSGPRPRAVAMMLAAEAE
jgi:uncharacterized protein YkwD